MVTSFSSIYQTTTCSLQRHVVDSSHRWKGVHSCNSQQPGFECLLAYGQQQIRHPQAVNRQALAAPTTNRQSVLQPQGHYDGRGQVVRVGYILRSLGRTHFHKTPSNRYGRQVLFYTLCGEHLYTTYHNIVSRDHTYHTVARKPLDFNRFCFVQDNSFAFSAFRVVFW